MDNERHCLEAERDERDLRSKSAVERLVSILRQRLGMTDGQFTDSEILERTKGTFLQDSARLQVAMEDFGEGLKRETQKTAKGIKDAVKVLGKFRC